jgi:hypothetical protein
MVAHYWPLALTLAGILGVVGQNLLAWVVVLVAGLLSLLS